VGMTETNPDVVPRQESLRTIHSESETPVPDKESAAPMSPTPPVGASVASDGDAMMSPEVMRSGPSGGSIHALTPGRPGSRGGLVSTLNESAAMPGASRRVAHDQSMGTGAAAEAAAEAVFPAAEAAEAAVIEAAAMTTELEAEAEVQQAAVAEPVGSTSMGSASAALIDYTQDESGDDADGQGLKLVRFPAPLKRLV